MPRRIVRQARMYHGRFLSVDIVTTSDGFEREIVFKNNAVGILIYDPVIDAVILVSQLREAMINSANVSGRITEIPAGHIKSGGVKETIRRELEEEIGAKISIEQVQLINDGEDMAMSPGWSTETMFFAYVELKPGQLDMSKKNFGLASEGEQISRYFVRTSRLNRIVFKDLKTFAMVQWFLRYKEGR